jgi:ferric-dicitrate binding protein FerR (iron transport regulator)
MVIEHNDDILSLIIRNLSGLADSVETAELKKWIESSAYNKQYFEQLRNIWDASDIQIDPTMINTDTALKKVRSNIHDKSLKRIFWYYWQKVAAVIILPIAIGTMVWIYLNSHKTIFLNELVYNEVHTAFGTRSSLWLADSTLVWLNSGSSLRYPNKFTNKSRKVFLEGEAYFEVESDISRPFIIQTPTLQVIATGTKFNVNDYDSYPLTEVTLVSGSVFVNESNNNNQLLNSELKPDQHFAFNRHSKEKTITDVDTYRFIAWKDGKLIFRNESLDNVLKRLSTVFNVNIEIQGEELKDYRYRATFEEESLEEILKLLKLSAPIDYIEVKRNPLPDGTFPKKKVILFTAKQINHK